jgi:hypothetical protein
MQKPSHHLTMVGIHSQDHLGKLPRVLHKAQLWWTLGETDFAKRPNGMSILDSDHSMNVPYVRPSLQSKPTFLYDSLGRNLYPFGINSSKRIVPRSLANAALTKKRAFELRVILATRGAPGPDFQRIFAQR